MLAALGAPSVRAEPAEARSAEARSAEARSAGSWFVDRAEEWGIDFVYETGRDGRFLVPEIFGSGVGVLDYDRDGDLDLYLAGGGELAPEGVHSQRDRLFRQDVIVDTSGLTSGAGSSTVTRRFVEVGESAGLGAPSGEGSYGMGVATGDVDGDGWTDVYVTAYGRDRLWRNRGDGTFEDATEAWGLAGEGDEAGVEAWSVPAVFLDFDADGRLDLWVGRYLEYRVDRDVECAGPTGVRDYCGPLVYGPLHDLLWRNVGGRFEDVSRATGLSSSSGRALGGVAFDADGDGRLDLYVANDLGENFLWRNVDGPGGSVRFVDEALLAGAALNRRGEAEGSMGVEAQDHDGDGDEDLFMTHTTLESNTLFENQAGNEGAWLFDDRSRESGLGAPSIGRTGFGTVWTDFDLDGELDVFVANGAVRSIEALARQGDAFPYHQPDQLFVQVGGVYREVQDAGLQRSDTARAAAAGDLDQDGDTDLVVAHLDASLEVFENLAGDTASHAARWLGVRVVGDSGRDFLGTRVGLRLGDRIRWRRVRSDGGYGAAHDPRVVFGLPREAGEDDSGPVVDVQPPELAPRRWRGLPSGSYVVLPVSGMPAGSSEP